MTNKAAKELGKRRWLGMTAEEISAQQSKNGKARMSKLTAKQRSAIASKAGLASAAKRMANHRVVACKRNLEPGKSIVMYKVMLGDTVTDCWFDSRERAEIVAKQRDRFVVRAAKKRAKHGKTN